MSTVAAVTASLRRSSGHITPCRALTSRSLYTLSTASAFCCKGSLSYFNRNSGDDAIVNATWIIPGPHQGSTALGVTDGVAGWAKYGIDTSMLSHALAREVTHAFEADEGASENVPSPQSLLAEAFSRLQVHGEKFAGGTTVCLGTFDPANGKLSIANLGDSGFVVIRKGDILYASERDVVGNVPRQLAIPTKDMMELRRNSLKQSDENIKPRWMQTNPNDAVLAEVELEHGDVIVFGTDGLFDNVFNNYISQSITDSMTSRSCWIDNTGELTCGPLMTGCESIAEMLVKKAYYNSLDPNYASPFAMQTFKEGLVLPGGKPDDIAVLVAAVNVVPDIAGDMSDNLARLDIPHINP